MESFLIQGGKPLSGSISISGSKNASLPLMAAALLTDEPINLIDVPDLKDIRNMATLLGELGCTITHDKDDNGQRTTTIHAADVTNSHARYDIVRTMRASICVLGPLLAKRGTARVSMPGGCAIGDRPVDLHLRGLEALGAHIHLEGGDIVATADRLKGATIFLGGPFGSTVLGTANVMSAATLAKGTTIIESAACEPEIQELAELLNMMGARITGAGSPRITIVGVDSLSAASHRIMPDRIEAGTYIIAAAIANSPLSITNCPADCLLALTDRLHHAGVELTKTPDPKVTASQTEGWGQRYTVKVHPPRHIKPIQMTTQPHPGFPTDLQAQLMALLSLADGISVITEKIYPDRFMHVPELSRMGATLIRQGPSVIINGQPKLIGAPVMASDLRASASLVLAGLAAEETTIVNRVYHLDRGYEHMETKLAAVGASIKRVAEE